MKTHTISVTVEKDSIQVSPDTLVMTRKDHVQWQGKTAHRFTIRFDGASPFDSGDLSHDVAKGASQPKAKGRFKYSVVSEDNPGLVLDPVIIVNDPPTQTEP